jgi:1-phosphatidylinositol phosphodiesterase
MKYFSRSNVRRMVRLVGMMLLGMLCLTPGAQIARAESSGARYYNDEETISTSHTDWMKWVPDDFSLAQMSIPGTHDTMTYNLPAYTAAWTQNLSLKTQLEAGIRAIDIRAKHENNTFELVHDKVDLDMEFRRDVLNPIDEFLKAHPDETILMRLKEEAENEAVGNTRSFAKTFLAYRDDENYTNNFWPARSPLSDKPAIPALGEVRGKIVLLRNFAPISGEEYGLAWNDNPNIDIQDDYKRSRTDNKYNYAVAPQFDNAQNHEPDCDPPIGTADENTFCKLYINHTSASGIMPYHMAGGLESINNRRGVNDYTLEFLFERGELRRTGVIMMDFPGAGLIDVIIAHNLRYTTNIPGAAADFAYIAQNLAHSAEGTAQGRYEALKRFFTLFVPSSQSVSVVVWNTYNAYIVSNYDGWYGYESDVYGYSSVVLTSSSKAATISRDEIASVVGPIINSFTNQDTQRRAEPLHDALSGHWPTHGWMVVVHQDPSDSNWAVDPVGSVYSSSANGYGYEIRGVPLATAPTITPEVTPAAPNGQNGWYTNGEVYVTWTIDENGSAITSHNGCNSAAITSDTMGTTLTCSATNAKGTTEQSVTIKRDTTFPTIGTSGKKADGTPYVPNSWSNQAVTVHFSCADATSGVASCPADQTISAEGNTPSVIGRAVDNAGNGVTAAYGAIKIDTIKPTISAATDRAANTNSWYNRDVTVSFTCADNANGSGITTCPAPKTLGEGANQSASGTTTDHAGNTSNPASLSGINVDKTAPTMSASAKNADGTLYTAGSWSNQTVTVHFTCSDALSGLAGSCPADQTFSADGVTQSVSGSAADKADNSASASFGPVKVDKTLPTVTYTGNAGTYTPDQTVSITCTATDSLSGVASSTCKDISGPAYTFAVGSNSFSAQATDTAGNVGVGATSFTLKVTSASISTVIQQFVTNPGVADSLAEKANEIATAPNANAKANKLQAFIQLVQAQTGKSITQAQADILIKLAKGL